MRRWIVLDRWLQERVPEGKRLSFSSQDLGYRLQVPSSEASGIIQAYLTEQRHPDSYTRYWLHRQGRTSNARWIASARTSDLKLMSNQYADDVVRRIGIAVAPDLDRIRQLNPKTAKLCDKIMDSVEEMLVALQALNGKQ
jgi:hypothetical protein